MSDYWLQSYSIEETNIFLVDDFVLREALEWIAGCENCTAHAVISFDYVLDAITGSDPTQTEYILCRPPMCPECSEHITEKTLVRVA